MDIDLICNTCDYETKGDPDMIGDKCPKCDTGNLIDATENGEGDKPDTSMEPKEAEVYNKLIDLVKEENMVAFKKEFKKVLSEKIKNKIEKEKENILKEMNGEPDQPTEPMPKVGQTGILDDSDEFSVKAIDGNMVTIMVGEDEITLSKEELMKRAKLNSTGE